MERNQSKSIYTLRKGDWGKHFLGKRSWRAYTGSIQGGKYGNAGTRLECRVRGRKG